MKSIFEKKSVKGQITVFIIIGIVILFSVGLYSYLKLSGVGPAEILQPKSPPVTAFVEACLENTAKEALNAMGDQGGYIVIPQAISLNPTRYVALIPGVGGDFTPKVPYWYFDGMTNVPGLRYMEIEVENYVRYNLENCLNGFEQLSDEYIVTEKSNKSVSVIFSEKDVVISLDYEIEINPRGTADITKTNQFITKLDVPIKRMWTLANDILAAENKKTFFENLTINTMSSFPADDIPFTGMMLDCRKKQWRLSDIKTKLNEVLEPAVSAVRFKHTDHPPFKDDDDAYLLVHEAVKDWKESETYRPLVLPKDIPSDAYDYFQYYFDFSDGETSRIKKEYPDLKVVSTYKKDWGMNLLATPNEFGILKSTTKELKSQIMSMLCLNTYHFVYDISYPIMVSINAPGAFHNSGFVFRFAFPVQVFHNAPDRSLLSTKIIEPVEYDLDYCESYDTEEHTIIAKDVVTNAELSRVNLTFRCLRHQCALGRTKTNNRHLQWSGNFPEGCYAPVIVAEKEGYLAAEKQYDYIKPFYIDMYPTQNVSFEVQRHTSLEPDLARHLDPNMYAIIQIENQRPELSVFDVYGGDEIFKRNNTFALLRADATYYVNIALMEKLNADEDVLIGGWIGNWTVRASDMLDAKKIVFHIPQKVPRPKTDLGIIEVYHMMTNRSLFPTAVPEIIRADEEHVE